MTENNYLKKNSNLSFDKADMIIYILPGKWINYQFS